MKVGHTQVRRSSSSVEDKYFVDLVIILYVKNPFKSNFQQCCFPCLDQLCRQPCPGDESVAWPSQRPALDPGVQAGQVHDWRGAGLPWAAPHAALHKANKTKWASVVVIITLQPWPPSGYPHLHSFKLATAMQVLLLLLLLCFLAHLRSTHLG